MNRTRAWNSYWNAFVVTSTWQSFYVNEERFSCVSIVKSKGCVLQSRKHGYLLSLEFAIYLVEPCPGLLALRPSSCISLGSVEEILQVGCFNGGERSYHTTKPNFEKFWESSAYKAAQLARQPSGQLGGTTVL